MPVMSELHAELSSIQYEKDEAFGIYTTLLEYYSPVSRTPAQEHEIHLARQRALAAREAVDNFKFWERNK